MAFLVLDFNGILHINMVGIMGNIINNFEVPTLKQDLASLLYLMTVCAFTFYY